jgi:hypothetical protein
MLEKIGDPQRWLRVIGYPLIVTREAGAVRTLYTFQVQDMVYTFFTFCWLFSLVSIAFLRADIRPQKACAGGVDLPEQ